MSTVLILVTCYLKYVYTYWERKGFPVLKATSLLGCLGPVLRQEQSMGELFRDVYLRSKEPFLGMYMLFRPTLLIRDPVLVKRVLIADFDHFYDRGVHFDEENDPIGASLFGMPGQQWKELRAKLSPTFTSGKLKNMFGPIEDKSVLMKEYLNELTNTEDKVHLKTVLIRLNLSIIASVFFGFELNAFEDPDHEFNQLGDQFFDPTIFRNKVASFGFFLCPTLLKTIKFSLVSPTVSKYVLNLVTSVIEARKADPSLIRPDFIQTMTDMMQDTKDKDGITVAQCAAESFLFYTAGYETSASTTAFCVFELCHNPVWMRRARAEVDALIKKRNGRIVYEDLSDMKVLDMCLKETMRKYPAAPILNRECTKEYKIPGTDLVVPKGMPIILSNYGLQMDEDHFIDPQTFDPSRFEAENAGDDLPYYPVRRRCGYDVVDLLKKNF